MMMMISQSPLEKKLLWFYSLRTALSKNCTVWEHLLSGQVWTKCQTRPDTQGAPRGGCSLHPVICGSRWPKLVLLKVTRSHLKPVPSGCPLSYREKLINSNVKWYWVSDFPLPHLNCDYSYVLSKTETDLLAILNVTICTAKEVED